MAPYPERLPAEALAKAGNPTCLPEASAKVGLFSAKILTLTSDRRALACPPARSLEAKAGAGEFFGGDYQK